MHLESELYRVIPLPCHQAHVYCQGGACAVTVDAYVICVDAQHGRKPRRKLYSSPRRIRGTDAGVPAGTVETPPHGPLSGQIASDTPRLPAQNRRCGEKIGKVL